MALEIKVKRNTVHKFYKNKITKNKEIVDKNIRDGLTLKEIGASVDVGREAVRQYINKSGQHDGWRLLRKISLVKEKISELEGMLKEKRRKGTNKDLINILKNLAIKKAEKVGAGEAMISHLGRNGRVSLRKKRGTPYLLKLIKLFDVYNKGISNDEKLSLKELAETSGIGRGDVGAARVSYILKKINLRSLKRIIKITPPWKKEAIERAEKNITYFGRPELAYFLDMNPATVIINSKIKKTSNRGGKIKFFSKGFGTGEVNALTYKDASQIYGFKDEFDVPDEEISRAIGKNLRVVSYALEHRDGIEPNLIRGIRILFPDKIINKPYI